MDFLKALNMEGFLKSINAYVTEILYRTLGVNIDMNYK